MTEDQRSELIRLLQKGEPLSPEWAHVLFPPEKREYELVYHGKEREEDIIADALAVPLQPVRTFGNDGGNGWHNMLIFGDNLQVMKTFLEMKKAGHLCNADGTPGARLIYIDPPFATKQEFKGTEDQKAYQDKIVGAEFLEFLRKRLLLLRELLSEDGSIYVHCDWKKSHYIRVLLDDLFGESRFVNEVVWYYTNKYGANSAAFDSFHNNLYRFRRGSDFVFNPIRIPVKVARKQPLRAWNKTLNKNEWLKDKKGNYLYKESVEKDAGDVWELPVINPMAEERLGYPTQKPETLLDWVIRSSSKQGDLVLDAFAGSGTTCAVAEKLGRRWVGIDCGKLAIYTIQKRMLNLRKEIGNKGPQLAPKSFSLYNAGLYDFSKLKELAWNDWRFFALQLFQCQDKRHRINGIDFDGYRQGASVLLFNHMEGKHKGARITEDTVHEVHEAVGSRVGNKVFIIAPALTFDYQQDYVDFDKVRYYALRIPYSIIHELHRREFTALRQPSDELAVNDTVEAVGFDFIRTPELKYKTGSEKTKGEDFSYIKIETFKSDAVVREPSKKRGNLETLSIVMLDLDYDESSKLFDLDEVHYANAIAEDGWKVRFPTRNMGKKVMAVFLDIYGNEARVLIDAKEFRAVRK